MFATKILQGLSLSGVLILCGFTAQHKILTRSWAQVLQILVMKMAVTTRSRGSENRVYVLCEPA